MTFLSERLVKSVRKPRQCEACGQMIESGQQAISWAGLTDGQFGALTYHPECRAAEIELNRLVRSAYDNWIGLWDFDWEDAEWLLTEHPVVAARKGITTERLAEHKAERERIHRHWLEDARKREADRTGARS